LRSCPRRKAYGTQNCGQVFRHSIRWPKALNSAWLTGKKLRFICRARQLYDSLRQEKVQVK
jgi:hypothetical protein